MEYYQLDNGVKIIYKNTESKLTSISIGLDAGAGIEKTLWELLMQQSIWYLKGQKLEVNMK